MTAKDFRRLALALPETEERSHMERPDFRVCGKIFATLGYPDKSQRHGEASSRTATLLLERTIPKCSNPSREPGDVAALPA